MMDQRGSWLQFRVARALRCTRAPRFLYRSGYNFSASEATICSERGVAGQWIPKREQFQIAVAEVVPRVDDDCKLFAGEIFVANPWTIIAKYLIIFKPLMESFSTGRMARLCRGSRSVSRRYSSFRNASSTPHTRFAP